MAPLMLISPKTSRLLSVGLLSAVDAIAMTVPTLHHALKAAEIVGGLLTDYLGEEMAPWKSEENAATAAST